MSVLQLPRANFHGTTTWDPNTANNSNKIYNEDKALPIKPPGVAWDSFVDWLTDTVDVRGGGKTVRGGWNVYGDHAVKFDQLTFVSAETADGRVADDPLIGKPIAIFSEGFTDRKPGGRLVDVDPYGTTSSQIFFDRVVIGDDDVGVTGRRVTRMYSRWMGGRNLDRNGELMIAGPAGVIWQCGLDKDRLEWSANADSSPTLKALRQAIEANPDSQGIVLTFATYRTLYYQTASYKGQRLDDAVKLSAAYKDGFTGGNPAVSVTTGSLGLWGAHELSTGPTDRFLVPAQRGSREAALSAVGPASARLDKSAGTVTLDMVATVPETDAELTKADLGDLSLQVVPAGGGTPVTIGTSLPYSGYERDAYQGSGGIVTFDLGGTDPETVESGTLQVVSAKYNVAILSEQVLLADTDQRGCYVDQDEEREITVRVYDRGSPVADGKAKILISQFDSNWSRRTMSAVMPDGTPLNKVVLDVSNGTASFKVKVTQPGIVYLVYTAFPADQTPPTVRPDPQTQGYTALRGMPFDNQLEQNTSDDELSWKFLYENVLRTWDKVYPIMSEVRSLHTKNVFADMAEQVRFAVDLQQFETGWYMPITRDLSAGKRKLILRYLNLLPNRVPPDDDSDTQPFELPSERAEV
jgi:hypothetical protein